MIRNKFLKKLPILLLFSFLYLHKSTASAENACSLHAGFDTPDIVSILESNHIDKERAIDAWLFVTAPMTEEDIEEENYMGDLELIAQLVRAEAGNQDLTGKRLVADVVFNRVASPRFPNNIQEVIFQPGQFTAVSNGTFWSEAWNMDDSDYKAVSLELEGRMDPYILFFSTYKANGTGFWKHGDHWFSY